MARLPLELPDDGGQITLLLLGMHLKAIPTQPKSCHQREAQARVAQGILRQALEESPFVVATGNRPVAAEPLAGAQPF